jgi:hypothetical protein
LDENGFREGACYLITLFGYSVKSPENGFFLKSLTKVPGLDLAEEWVRQGCLIRGTGHPVFVLNTDELFFRETITLALTATPSQKIIDEAHALWRDALRGQLMPVCLPRSLCDRDYGLARKQGNRGDGSEDCGPRISSHDDAKR